tara:strand:- start:177 stop:353 length:177 start_codon:yes stop_codon:yes gene_type:complete
MGIGQKMLNKIPRGGRKIAAAKRTIDEIVGTATSRIFILLVGFIKCKFDNWSIKSGMS